MKIVLTCKEVEDVISATLNYAMYLGKQAYEFSGDPQISEALANARDAVLRLNATILDSPRTAKTTELDLSESEEAILRKVCSKISKKYYDKSDEYRGTFLDVYEAFEAAGDRYSAIVNKLTEKQ